MFTDCAHAPAITLFPCSIPARDTAPSNAPEQYPLGKSHWVLQKKRTKNKPRRRVPCTQVALAIFWGSAGAGSTSRAMQHVPCRAAFLLHSKPPDSGGTLPVCCGEQSILHSVRPLTAALQHPGGEKLLHLWLSGNKAPHGCKGISPTSKTR